MVKRTAIVTTLVTAFAVTACTLAARVEQAASGDILLSKGAWKVISSKGNAVDVKLGEWKVIESIGNTRVEECPDVCNSTDSALFAAKGLWRGQPYARWETRMDDGTYYVTHIDQVTHVGKVLTWTAHVYWLPPAFYHAPHLNVEMVLPKGVFNTARAAGKTIKFASVTGKGVDLLPAETSIYQEYLFVLDGPGGPITIRPRGFEPRVRLVSADAGVKLIFREDAPKMKLVTSTKRERWMSYWMEDPKVRRLTLQIGKGEMSDRDFLALRKSDDAVFENVQPPPPDSPAPSTASLRRGEPGKAYAVDYEQLRGARRKGSKGTWDIGWRIPKEKNKPIPTSTEEYKSIQGVWYADFGGTGAPTAAGTQLMKSTQLLPRRTGLELPHLGLLGDVAVFHTRDRIAPERYFDDSGRIVQEHYFYTRGVTKPQWFHMKKPDTKHRRKYERRQKGGGLAYPSDDGYILHRAFLDSRRIDSDRDGKWNPASGTLVKLPSYRMKQRLGWFMLMPATWLDVPAGSGDQVRFKYHAKDGIKEASIALDPAHLPKRGAIRIGFMNRHGGEQRHAPGVYVVQSVNGHGRIVGKIGDAVMADRLSIVAGTLRMDGGGKWRPVDRIPIEKRRWTGPQHCRGGLYHNVNPVLWWSEHTYWENFFISDWGYHKLHVYGGFGNNQSTYQDPFMDLVARPIRMNPKPEWKRAEVRSGRRMGFMIYTRGFSRDGMPDAFRGECMDARKGTFYKVSMIDWSNPLAMDWLRNEYRKVLLPFKGVTPFVLSAELRNHLYAGYDEESNPLWGGAALQSWRQFLKRPSAKLPTDTFVKDTARTTGKVSDETWKKYIVWNRRQFTNHCLVLYEGAHNALSGDPYYMGGGYFAIGGIVSPINPPLTVPMDLETLASSPAFGKFVYESLTGYETPQFKAVQKILRKHNKKLFVLFNADPRNRYPYYHFVQLDNMVQFWETQATKSEHLGVIMCGLTHPQSEYGRLWYALASKHYGKGPMTLDEAQAVIDKITGKAAPGKAVPKGPQSRKIDVRKMSRMQADGKLADWKGVKKVPFDRFMRKTEAQARKAGWGGKTDLSGDVMFAYDDDALHIAARIRDDKVNKRSSVGINPLTGIMGDQVEVFASPPPDIRVTGKKVPGIMLNKKWAVAREWRLSFVLMPGAKNIFTFSTETGFAPVRDGKMGYSITDDGYIVEASFPWSVLNGTARKGDSIALEVFVKDKDDPFAVTKKPCQLTLSSNYYKCWVHIHDWAQLVLN